MATSLQHRRSRRVCEEAQSLNYWSRLCKIPEPSLMLGFFMRQCFELCTKCEAEGGSLLLIGFDPDSPMMFLND